MELIYFDYNATTPLDPAVREAMLPFLGEVWGNPSSVHSIGRRARVVLDTARERVAAVLGCKPSEVVFTSGGTESANLAIFGTARLLQKKGRHLITSRIEHHAVLNCFEYLEKKEGFEITYLPVDRFGVVSVSDLESALRPDTTLVSLMAANNEVGTIEPVAECGALCQRKGIKFHTDAVQWFGKESFIAIEQFQADLVSMCGHKLHGPKGAGFLYIKSPLHPDPILFGGGHEHERRAGTENLAAIAGLTEAVERFVRWPIFDSTKLLPLTNDLAAFLSSLDGVTVVSPSECRLANTLSFVVRGADSIGLLAGLDLEGICASSGSACSAGSLEPSHVIRAMGYETQLANALVRLSLGRESTPEQVSRVKSILPEVICRSQISE
jgi:cysteine desulfurase